ncbi:hypothetical protein BKA60DRAFT_647395 [Fusarium oxysporum]|nr:hypothetical protein BKA60DRAFT_647395 [Fusarium oxysporum]
MPPTSTNRVTLSNPQFLINSTADPKCQEAFSIIENENLPHPLGKLLASFIANALYPALATTHVLNHCPPGQRRKTDLHVLISDWTFIVESNGNRCCIMGKPASFGDPLVVMPVVLAPSRWLEAELRVLDMLRAFFTPPYLDWWNGPVKLHRLHPSMIQVQPIIDVDGQYPLLGDHSRSGIRKVDTRFIGTHARLASSMRWLGLRRRYALQHPGQDGHHLYGSTSSLAVSRLPFGLYLKSTNEGEFNESNAIRLFVDQMQSFIPQIRAIPPVGPKNHIYNTLGQACSDPRIRDGNLIGPFDDEASFSQYLRHPDDPARRCHQVVFTPSDLNLRNILAISGIVDWENSGFHPEYWDFTKAQFEGFRWDERWARALVEVFRPFGGYAKEIELGKRSWTEGDGAF